MVPTPSAEGWDRLTDAWLERCDEIARGVHYREDVPIRDLFETDLDHMLPLPPSMFDACDWRGVKADRTGTVTIDSNRYLAGPKWHSMRLMAGVRALRVELRSMDGEPIVTLERRWGRSPDTAMDPLSLLAIIARKPRSWGESPIRSDFPEETRALLDRMEPRVCFCKLAPTVWALFFSSIGGWFPAETAPSEPAAPFFLGYLVMRACSLR